MEEATKMDKAKLIIVLLIIVGFLGLLFGFIYGQNKGEQDLLNEQKAVEQEGADEAEKEKEFNLVLNKVCSLSTTESRVTDLTKCAFLKEDNYLLYDLDSIKRLESDLEGIKLPSFCNKKIAELNLGEITECLNYEDDPD